MNTSCGKFYLCFCKDNLYSLYLNSALLLLRLHGELENVAIANALLLPKVDSSSLAQLNNDYCYDFIVEPIEVANRLATINIFKAPGPDSLQNWLLPNFAPYLCEPLAAIFNSSIPEGFIRPIWKSAEVIPVPKISSLCSIQNDLRMESLCFQQ